MKFSAVALTLAATGTLAAAQPHRHHKHRHIKRTANADVEHVPGPIVYYYEFEGEKISEEKVCEGIENGTLEWADGTPAPSACNSKPESEEKEDPPPKDAQFFEMPDQNNNNVYPTEEETTSSSSSPPSTTEAPTSAPNYSAPSNPGGKGLDSEFPDGKLSCSEFPSDYGAVPADWLDLGGFTGLQFVTITNNMVSDIATGIRGDKCSDGAMCSYACPAGYQKTQWPSTQGSTGQSVGGLECRNGKLYLTNKELSNKLCMAGTGEVKVKNTLSQDVAVCRTDYPGTESETIALDAAAGSTQELTCPDASKYYFWKELSTTAQYYINPAGVSVAQACQWGDGSKPWGNFAPMNLGVGKTDGLTFLSIFPNAPTTTAKLEFNIKLTGDFGGSSCKYEDGEFYENGVLTQKSGCTVQLKSGKATYEFY